MTLEELQKKITDKTYDNAQGENFYEDLCAVFSLNVQDPLSNRMYSMAWRNGHSAGYQEVLGQFQDLVYVFQGNH